MVVKVLWVVARVLCGRYGVVNACIVGGCQGAMWSLRCCGWLPGCYVVVKVL